MHISLFLAILLKCNDSLYTICIVLAVFMELTTAPLVSLLQIRLQYFPFDDQTCNLKLSSWMYDGTKVRKRQTKSLLTKSVDKVAMYCRII
jgi:hypothetical protein